MNDLSLNQEQFSFFIRARKNISFYLKNNIYNSNGFITMKNNKVENLYLEFDLELSENNIIKYISAHSFEVERKQPVIHFKSISFEKINDEISFVTGLLTINKVTKTIELEAYYKIISNKNGKSKVYFDVVGEINKNEFGISIDNRIRINGKILGKNIKVEGFFEFLKE